MRKILPILRWQYSLVAVLFFVSFTNTQLLGQISMSCPNDISITAVSGSNSAVGSWITPSASTTCTIPLNDCSLVGENINGFIYMGEYNGSKYFCSDGNSFTWFQARDLSIAAGGSLVTINDAGENEFVRSVIGADEVWIGYNDASSEGDFGWVSGEASSYENWTCWSSNDCEPNQTGDYVRLLKSNGEWGDQAGDNLEEFVMEIPCSACQTPAISGFIYMGMNNNSKYYCSDGSDFTFAQAKNLSAAAGGHLVTINDDAENEFVRSVIGASNVWIGYTDENSEGDFYWLNGETSSYTNWKSWAPDGGSSQNYTVLYKNGGEWNDKGSDWTTEFVMEVPCSPNTTPGSVTVLQTAGLESGSAFAIGSHTISYTATDECGNTETCSFSVTVSPGQPAIPASVGDFVWSDTNENGIQDVGEPGIEGVFVMITDCDGNWVNNMLTDANGAYQFNDLAPGEYKIKFVAPQDYTVSLKDAGTDDANDSDVNTGWTGFTDCFTLASGENNTSIDAGFVPNAPTGTLSLTCNDDITVTATNTQNTAQVSWGEPTATSTCNTGSVSVTQSAGPTSGSIFPSGTTTISYNATDGCGNFQTCSFTVTVEPSGGNNPASVGDFVWSDTNGNGIQDAGEPGIGGVFIMLTDCAGNWKGQTTSGTNGAYSFTNVTPGSYKIKFVTPANHTNAPTNAGSDDTKDSDLLQGWTGFTECFDLASGQNRTDIDAGFVPENPSGGCDNFTDGGAIGGTQTICSGGDAALLTNVALPTGGAGGIEYLWMAKAGTTCPNNASYTIAGANGPSYDPGVLTETTTFRRCARRVGCTSWPGESNCITVTVDNSPECGQGNDPASVGDFVWSDTNGNGIQDAGEPGIADVFIMLTDCAGNWKGQTTSDANGAYSFDDLTPGSYKIKFVTPANYSNAPTDAGTDDAKDSDLLQGWTGFTECFDLASGENRTDIDAGFVPDGQTGGDLTLTCSDNVTVTAPANQSTAVMSWVEPNAFSTCSGSATLNQTSGPMNNQPMAIGTQTVSYSASDNCGNYETCSFTVTVEAGVPVTPGSIGDFVWNDLNGNGLQDAGEPGLEGVFVMLTDCAGNWKGQTTTDADGAYHFANVAPGSYKVKFVGPLGSSPAPTNAGNGNNDSDLLQGWTGFTACFDVAAGDSITNIDAGFTGVTQASTLTMSCNDDMNVDASNPAGTIVTWSAPSATSTCSTGSVTVTQTAGPSSGDLLVTGTHTVTYVAEDGCGNTETCSFTITVSYTGSAICTTRLMTDLTQCNGSINSTFWAEDLIYGMSNISKNYHLEAPGTFTEYEDGTARFAGVVVNNTNSDAKFSLDFTLTGKMAAGNAHDAYCFTADMSDWYFYSSMSGTITGLGVLDGAVINGVHHMYSPQIGTGANLHQNVFGFTSWVELSVISQPNNSNITLDDNGTAHADLNFNLSGDPASCAPDVVTCATREVWDAYQCNVGLDFGFYANGLINQFGGSADETHFEEKGNSTFVENTDGTAHLSMKVRSHEDWSVKFQIELDFSGRTFTAPSDANDNAYGCYDADNSDWYYYTNVTGTITGLADMAGAEIDVWNTMHPFQIGTGAALWGDWNDFGGTTWLGYNVVSQPDNYYILSDGGYMDVNVHMSGNATACGGTDYVAASSKVMDLALEQDEFVADLTWQNNTGDINEYFVVERSNDGINFTPIAQVASNVTAESVVASYTFQDAEPEEGDNYYQVVAVTKDNKKFISNMTQAVFGNRSDITLFPNPAGEYFMIDLLPYKGAEATVTISNQLGQVVKTINLDEVDAAPVRVSLTQFINGYYNVQIQTTDGRKAAKKLVVARMY